MKHLLSALLVSASFFNQEQAFAQSNSGNPEVDLCLGEDPRLQGACLFFVKGAVQGLEMGVASVATKQGVTSEEALVAYQQSALLACPPENIGFPQYTAVLRKYLEDNPQNWHEPLIGLVLLALIDAFPCPVN